MANSKSAQKRVRQITTRTVQNRTLKSRVKSTRKAIYDAVEAGDSALAEKNYRAFISLADRAAKNSVIHKNAASRLKGRMAKAVSGIS